MSFAIITLQTIQREQEQLFRHTAQTTAVILILIRKFDVFRFTKHPGFSFQCPNLEMCYCHN